MTTWLNVKNNAQSSLLSAITADATTLTLVTDGGAKFPSSNFNISIDNEILTCSSRTGDVLVVTRAQEGTTAAAHAANAIVSLNVTAAIVTELQTAVGAIEGGSMLDDTAGGTNGLTTKAPTSNVMYDHNAATTGVHGAGLNTLLNTGDVDDTPVDGAISAPVSSNWAYDHNANASAHHVKTGLDDTPVDGEITKGITSNWAYDHVAAADPHTGYQKESEKGAASGYASLNASIKVVEQPASITDHLEATPTNGVTTKAPTSDWAYDHNAATTGVHGVGTNYVAKSSISGLDLAAHASRHELGGADPISDEGIFGILSKIAGFVYLNFQTFVGITAGATGSGVAPTAALGQITLKTGATSGSTSYLYVSTPLYNNIQKYTMRGWWYDATDPNFEAWFGHLTNPTAPTATEKHNAFKIVNKIIYCSTGNGTNGTLESTGITYTGQILTFIATGAVTRFYVGDTLVKSITTTLMTPASVYPTLYLKNTAAADVQIHVIGWMYKIG